MQLRIGLIEGNDLVRTGRSMVLNSQSDMQVVFEEASASLALTRIADYLIDVLLIGTNITGVDFQKYLKDVQSTFKAAGSHPAIIVLGNFADKRIEELALRAGASAMVDLQGGAEVLLNSIRTCSKLDHPINRTVLESYAADSSDLAAAKLEPLRDLALSHERVVENFLNGLSDFESSKKLDVAKLRVKQAIDSLMDVGDFYSRNQLAIALLQVKK
jgi:DNA-binding NarL/FixJ family response regulator